MSNYIENLAAEYAAANERADQISHDDCSITTLRSVWATRNHKAWAETEAALAVRYDIHGCPTEAEIDNVRVLRKKSHEERVRLGDQLYKALLEAGIAYEVVDHSDRLDKRPFEIVPANLPYVSRSFVTAHGSRMRLARYATREAADKAVVKIHAKELERLA